MVHRQLLPSKSQWTILICLVFMVCRGMAEPVTVNPDTVTYDYHPSTAVTADGTTWLAWHGYREGQDSILTRRVDASGTLGPLQTISDKGTAHSPPQLVASDDSVSIAWATMQDGGWRVVFREQRGDHWQAPVLLSQAEHDAIYPTIVESGQDSCFAAWSEHTNGCWRIRGCHIQGGRASAAFDVSSGAADAFRPTLVVHDSDVWACWDQYSQPNYSVHGRTVFPELLPEERVSPLGEYCLTPTAISHPHGLHVAWLRKVDVVGGPGVVSQWHSFHAAIRNAAGWQPIATRDGNTQAAELPVQSELTPRRTISAGGKTYQLFWADMHCHNGLTADAEGEPDEMHVYARDRANLDVVVFTNNDFYNVPLMQYDFELGHLFARTFSSAAATQGTRPFLLLPGFEWTSRIPGVTSASLDDSRNWLPPYQNASYPNHRSVIYPARGGPLVHFPEVGNDIAQLNAAVEQAGGITLSQHPAFQLSGHPVEVGLELTSGWGNYIASRPQLFHDALNTGKRYGFTANGDIHRRAPGLSGALTGIYAEELTADSILDALRNRRCFATMGAQMLVDSRANDAIMGQSVSVRNDSVTLTLYAIGTRPIVDAVLIRDGRPIFQVDGDGTAELSATLTDTGIGTGEHWYYWRVRQERDAPVLPGNLMVAHGHLAWSTPHWVTVD